MRHPFYKIGNDGTHWQWLTPSWTRIGIEHEVWLDADGKITCSCESASYRHEKRYAYLQDSDATNGCKHIRELHAMLREFLARRAVESLLAT